MQALVEDVQVCIECSGPTMVAGLAAIGNSVRVAFEAAVAAGDSEEAARLKKLAEGEAALFSI
jgi:hypothetical protein